MKMDNKWAHSNIENYDAAVKKNENIISKMIWGDFQTALLQGKKKAMYQKVHTVCCLRDIKI